MRHLLLTIFLFSANFISQAQTTVSGGIYQNATWTQAASPYIVSGSIVVFPGVTLTIEPGVEIQIDNQTNNNIYIETRGTINCIGTDTQPIIIRTLYDTLNTSGWNGFICTSTQGGIIHADRFHISNAYMPFSYETPMNNYQYTNCKFSHCFQAVTVALSVNLQNCQFIDNEVGVYGWSNFTIDNCLFKENTTSIFAYASSLQMTNSSFIDNQIGLNFATFVLDSIKIANCQFINNELALGSPNNGTVQNCFFSENTTAIQFAMNCDIYNNELVYNDLAMEVSVDAMIHDNQINNNVGGLLISSVSLVQESPQIYNNEICSNSTYNVNNNTNMNYSLLSNCFCGLDSADIEYYLIDGYDDITKGLINYSLYDSTCTLSFGTVAKFQDQNAGFSSVLPAVFTYSNPVADYLTIFHPENIEQVLIYSATGQQFLVDGIEPNVFDLRALLPGIYFVKSSTKNASPSVFRIIRQND